MDDAARREAIRRLCGALGIETGYHEISGRYVEVPQSSLLAVLREFGVGDGTAQGIGRDSVVPVDPAGVRLVAPLASVEAGAPGQGVALSLSASRDASAIAWRLTEESGARHEGDCVQAAALGRLDFPAALPPGYHRLELLDGDRRLAVATIVAAPRRCWEPPAIEAGGRVWGIAVQLYALRSARNWGIGDFGDLLGMIEFAAGQGADLVGLNPLHALFPHDPARCSPYSPSSRAWLNTLFIDVTAVEDLEACEPARRLLASAEFRARLERARLADQVDYPGVAALKHSVLRLLHRHFRLAELDGDTPRAREFRDFRASGGQALRAHALFEALQAHLHARDAAVWGWPAWPEAFTDRHGAAAARFEADHAEEVEYFEYLQWIAAAQLARAARRCDALGMRVGLYMDLAVSVDAGGSDTWAARDEHALGMGVGAPPDDFNLDGQDWGLPPLHPARLLDGGCEAFVRVLRANMREAGALRIDHVMGLMRLFWIPRGTSAAAGAYVRYPLQELLAIVALESHRNRCLVIGEDLGTVLDEMRAAMAERGLLSYRLLYFEREWSGDYRRPEHLPRSALVAIGTHDLPTFAGWWSGHDLRVRQALSMLPAGRSIDELLHERHGDRERMLRAVGRDPAEASGPLHLAIVQAVHAYLASSPCSVMSVLLEDLVGEIDQPNLPGTVDAHANWRRRIRVPVEALAADPSAVAVARAVSAQRGCASGLQ